VLYFTQVLGLAMGLSPKSMMLDRHFVPASHLLTHTAAF
jgi:heterodisulfide reductase subunit B